MKIRGEASGVLRFWAVDQTDPEAHQSQGDQADDTGRLRAVSEQQTGQDHSEHRIHKTIDIYPGYRVVFEQHAPERIGSGGDKCHIQEKYQTCETVRTDMPA